ncbi:MAG: TIGR03663 family protein [Verrucomicrobia bacterium]|nr:TIGR03663 family protein [Verrucomicrobiota bacterium]
MPDPVSPMLDSVRRWLPLAFVALAAFWLRTHDLARRPMHADEANQAVKLGELLERGRYAFDPRDHHGPTLYYAALPIAWLRGEHTLAALTETTVRLVPAFAGTLAVLLIAALAAPLGRWPALAAAAFVAVSPPAVYYGRYFIQETLLVTFTFGTFVCAREWWRSGRLRWAIATGACAGLMQATKSSAPLFLAAAAVAFLGGRSRNEAGSPALSPRPLRPRALALAMAAGLVVLTLFYSSFGTNPAGLRDTLAAYAHAWTRLSGGETGHEKAWWYYLHLFGWHREGGLLWQQVMFSALACAGLAIAFTRCLRPQAEVERDSPEGSEPLCVFGASEARSAGDVQTTALGDRRPPIELTSSVPWDEPLAGARSHERRRVMTVEFGIRGEALLRWAAVYTVLVVVALSASRYKTPWHAVHFVPGFALLAAGALAAVGRLRTGHIVAAAMALLALATLTHQTWRAAFVRPADQRNPYAYVHSSPDVLKFRALAEAALAGSEREPVRVISEEYWPLPWYLRGLPRVGYWSTPPADCDGALLIVSAPQAETVRARLHGVYHESFLGLRPGFLCIVFTRAR